MRITIVIITITIIITISDGATARSGQGSPHFRGFTITLRHTTLSRTPLDEWSARCRDLYLTKQHSQETDIHACGGIRTHNPSKQAAADPRLRPHVRWDRTLIIIIIIIIIIIVTAKLILVNRKLLLLCLINKQYRRVDIQRKAILISAPNERSH
jgi:hypothetical protein